MVLDFLAVDNFDFTRKIVKNNLAQKLVKMLGFCQNWIFGQKLDFLNSVSSRRDHRIVESLELNWGKKRDWPHIVMRKFLRRQVIIQVKIAGLAACGKIKREMALCIQVLLGASGWDQSPLLCENLSCMYMMIQWAF